MTGRFLRAFDALPIGTFTGISNGRRYVVTRSSFCGGASEKLVAEEQGGPDYISLNLYRLDPPRVMPCEMSTAKVVAFVLGLQPDVTRTSP